MSGAPDPEPRGQGGAVAGWWEWSAETLHYCQNRNNLGGHGDPVRHDGVGSARAPSPTSGGRRRGGVGLSGGPHPGRAAGWRTAGDLARPTGPPRTTASASTSRATAMCRQGCGPWSTWSANARPAKP